MSPEQLKQEIEDAQAEMVTWSKEKLASVQLEGYDPYIHYERTI